METSQEAEIPIEHVIAVVEHFDFSLGLVVKLINRELMLEECLARNNKDYENLKHLLFPERYLISGVSE